ncbi:MAG: hypothetical protein PHE17_18215 [Thiothrix sp.]|uniref:hypothetical protein n=1 Tax=Thiothrix sp. TaxID=1032 RepID=UPI0026110377|nr:hypothetical protein [Thiothrix sp.]MDD5394957.1 hypothetical protein [Thiothrix sp.]
MQKPKTTNQTEVVKIRLGCEIKAELQKIAEKEYRTFSDQCRMALAEWVEEKNKRRAGSKN